MLKRVVHSWHWPSLANLKGCFCLEDVSQDATGIKSMPLEEQRKGLGKERPPTTHI